MSDLRTRAAAGAVASTREIRVLASALATFADQLPDAYDAAHDAAYVGNGVGAAVVRIDWSDPTGDNAADPARAALREAVRLATLHTTEAVAGIKASLTLLRVVELAEVIRSNAAEHLPGSRLWTFGDAEAAELRARQRRARAGDG